MHTDDEIRLRHMLDAAREAISFVRDSTRSDLDTNRQFKLTILLREVRGMIIRDCKTGIPSTLLI